MTMEKKPSLLNKLSHLLTQKGKILDAERFTTTINKIVENFSKKLGGDFIENVVISLSHPEMIISRIYESKRILQEEVTEDDADHLSRIIDDISGKDNYETLKILPVCRIIDEEKKRKRSCRSKV